MPWFAPRAAAASKGTDPSSSSSPSTLMHTSSPPTISAKEWEEAGKSGSDEQQQKKEVSVSTVKEPWKIRRLAPPARAAGGEILFSAAAAGDVDAVSRSS